MKFLSNVLATLVGLFLFFGMLFFGLFVVGAIVGSGSEDAKKTTVERNSVIDLDLSEITLDHVAKVEINDFPLLNSEEYNGLINVLNAIDAAKTDDKIRGIVMKNLNHNLGLAQTKALYNKLVEFKKSGKFILSYADVYSQGQYYLGSTADTIYINPSGQFDFKGLASELLFFKDFQDKYGLRMEVIRHGKFKSAVEPYLQNKMSEENRLQMQELLNSIWNTVVTDIAAQRKVSVEKLNEIANNLSARTPEMALANKLVDRIVYQDQFEDAVKNALSLKKEDEINSIKIADYAANVAIGYKTKKSDPKVAIIYAQGQILDGDGNPTTIGEGYMREALQKAAKDENIKAIVLRVDSPGGSALASDIIWREIEITKRSKPVVVSMGNLAASGGYYISCNADRIFAEPTTITGSIGVFGTLPNVTEFINDKGIYADQVKTHNNSIDYSLFQPMSESTKNIITESIVHTYDTFLDRVSKGRKMTKEQVDAIGQGRVWTGADAIKIGLVDELGGLNKAVAYAAKKAGLDKFKITNLPVFEKTAEEFFKGLNPFVSSAKIREQIIQNEIGQENYLILNQLKQMHSQSGVQALLPYQIIIK